MLPVPHRIFIVPDGLHGFFQYPYNNTNAAGLQPCRRVGKIFLSDPARTENFCFRFRKHFLFPYTVFSYRFAKIISILLCSLRAFWPAAAQLSVPHLLRPRPEPFPQKGTHMLQIKQICKQYKTGDLRCKMQLNNVSLNLRDNEFVAILGPQRLPANSPC